MYEGPYRQPNESGDSIDSPPNSVGSTSIFRQTTELETCIWRPPNIKIPEHKIQEFVEKCYLDHGWAEEQALGILYVRKFNFRRAMDTTKTFEPMPCVMDSFTEDDRNAFFYAYKLHSRKFSKKRDMKLFSKIKGIGKKTQLRLSQRLSKRNGSIQQVFQKFKTFTVRFFSTIFQTASFI